MHAHHVVERRENVARVDEKTVDISIFAFICSKWSLSNLLFFPEKSPSVCVSPDFSPFQCRPFAPNSRPLRWPCDEQAGRGECSQHEFLSLHLARSGLWDEKNSHCPRRFERESAWPSWLCLLLTYHFLFLPVKLLICAVLARICHRYIRKLAEKPVVQDFYMEISGSGQNKMGKHESRTPKASRKLKRDETFDQVGICFRATCEPRVSAIALWRASWTIEKRQRCLREIPLWTVHEGPFEENGSRILQHR